MERNGGDRSSLHRGKLRSRFRTSNLDILRACLWLAPVKAENNGHKHYRPLQNIEEWGGPEQTEDSEFGLFLFPDRLRRSYWVSGITWYFAMMIFGPVFPHASQVGVDPFDIFHLIIVSVTLVWIWILGYFFFNLKSTAHILFWLAVSSLAAIFYYAWSNICISNFWSIECIEIEFKLDFTTSVAIAGLLLIAVIVPAISYAWWRRPVWSDFEKDVPILITKYVSHTPFEKVFHLGVKGELVIMLRSVKSFLGYANYLSEPVRWRSIPSIQGALTEISLNLYVLRVLSRWTGGWLIHGFAFLFGASILWYLALWMLAIPGVYDDRFLGAFALVWAGFAIFHALSVITEFGQKGIHSEVALGLQLAIDVEEIRARIAERFGLIAGGKDLANTVLRTTNIAFSILLVSYLTFLQAD